MVTGNSFLRPVGPLSYEIKLSNDQIIRRHKDHIHPNEVNTNNTPSTTYIWMMFYPSLQASQTQITQFAVIHKEINDLQSAFKPKGEEMW